MPDGESEGPATALFQIIQIEMTLDHMLHLRLAKSARFRLRYVNNGRGTKSLRNVKETGRTPQGMLLESMAPLPPCGKSAGADYASHRAVHLPRAFYGADKLARADAIVAIADPLEGPTDSLAIDVAVCDAARARR